MTGATPHLFWITSRAAGSVAMVLAGLSVGLGLSMAGRLVRGPAADRRVLHEALSLATMFALVVHGAVLLGDRPSVPDLTVPFVSSYDTLWLSLGIVAGWATVLLGLSFYVRGRIGVGRWRRLHRFTVLAWVLGIAHSLGMGTDASEPWFLALVGLALLPGAVALAWRLTERGPRARTTLST